MNHPDPALRRKQLLKALQRFAAAITILNILGHTVLGFEQAWIHPFIAVGTAYAAEFILECAGCLVLWRKPRFWGSPGTFVNFLLPAHISGLAVSMLLYPNRNFWVISFAAAVAIASKAIFRAPAGQGRTCHFLNPSNIGITITLLLFPWVGVSPPYQFTESIPASICWLIPLVMICTGSLVNAKLTKRVPLILAWLGGFVFQAWLRSIHGDLALDDSTFSAALAPMTGVAFILFTFYMVTDPMTTPEGRWGQIFFGAGVALAYGLIVASRGVFAMFFGLSAVCIVRGFGLYALALWRKLPQQEGELHASPEAAHAGLPSLSREIHPAAASLAD